MCVPPNTFVIPHRAVEDLPLCGAVQFSRGADGIPAVAHQALTLPRVVHRQIFLLYQPLFSTKIDSAKGILNMERNEISNSDLCHVLIVNTVL